MVNSFDRAARPSTARKRSADGAQLLAAVEAVEKAYNQSHYLVSAGIFQLKI